MKTILVALQPSEEGDEIIEVAVDLAKQYDAGIHLLTVIPPEHLEVNATAIALLSDLDEIDKERLNHASKRLEEIEGALRERGVASTRNCQLGVAVDVILAAAQKHAASFIVMGSHDHGRIYDLIIGSTAKRILEKAGCPVVVVPALAAFHV